jgi:hypothetical protein
LDSLRAGDPKDLGDQFIYHQNYVDKDQAQIARHFGKRFAAELFQLSNPSVVWHGPIASPYGQHLVAIQSSQEAHTPELKAIFNTVKQDAEHAHFLVSKNQQIEKLRSQYKVIRTTAVE